MNSLQGYLKVAGGYFPFFLPLIAYSIGFPELFMPLVLDFALINPTLKRLVYKLGLQTKRPICEDLSSYQCFGMPSGHTEIHWILLSYMILYYLDNGFPQSTKDRLSFLLVVVMTIIVMWQRLITGKHTAGQILGGVITGSIIGFLLYKKLFQV